MANNCGQRTDDRYSLPTCSLNINKTQVKQAIKWFSQIIISSKHTIIPVYTKHPSYNTKLNMFLKVESTVNWEHFASKTFAKEDPFDKFTRIWIETWQFAHISTTTVQMCQKLSQILDLMCCLTVLASISKH